MRCDEALGLHWEEREEGGEARAQCPVRGGRVPFMDKAPSSVPSPHSALRGPPWVVCMPPSADEKP